MASNAAVRCAPTVAAAWREPIGVAPGQNDVGALGAGAPGGLESDPRTTTDADDGLSEQLRSRCGNAEGVSPFIVSPVCRFDGCDQ